MASGTSSTTTRCSDDSTNAPTPSPGPLPSAESVSHVPGHSVSYVPGCSQAMANWSRSQASGVNSRLFSTPTLVSLEQPSRKNCDDSTCKCGDCAEHGTWRKTPWKRSELQPPIPVGI